MKYHSPTFRPVNADTIEEAAGVFARRISRRRLGRSSRFSYEKLEGEVFSVQIYSKRARDISPIQFFIYE